MEDKSYAHSVYHPRKPEESPLWQLLNNHYEEFEYTYEAQFEKRHGFFRSVVRNTVGDYLKCGDLKEGFARVKCTDCQAEYLLAFSCKGRWFCPSCHNKKVVQFGELLRDTILYPIPHRQYVFTIPVMLRVYFKYDRRLLSDLCRCAYDSLCIFLKTTLGLPGGVPGAVMAIHTFGDHPDKFHPHLHAIVADGLFAPSGTFYVMPRVDLKPLEEIFRARVFKMLKKKDKITDEIIANLMSWRHSGFSVHNAVRVARDDHEARERVAQYIIRNAFSVANILYNDKTGTVIYKAKMTHGKDKKNFGIYSAEEFIASVTQHIPEKSFQMVRYYGWYSNKKRGLRLKQGLHRPGDEPRPVETVEIIDVSGYQPKRIPSKTWRECIKKIWEVDPLTCPNCGGEMKIISFITERNVIRHILEHLGLWPAKPTRDPPTTYALPDSERALHESVCEPYDDGWPGYEESYTSVN